MSEKTSEEHIKAVQERRRSGASGLHGDRRMKRLRTKTSMKRAAIHDQQED